jgi:hypothetical protein
VCELCRHSPDPHNAFRQNAGHAGCGVFKVSTYKDHEAKYHPKVEQARAIHKSLEEQQASEDDRMVRVFMLVYWLASEGLPMLKIYTLAMLIRALDFRSAINCVWNVGRKYVNHMAATEIMMAMAAVLREWINGHARTSRVLGLMIDESTDISNKKVILLYLRFSVYGRYVTMFWAALPVTDGTAEGLHDLIERHFEAMNVPIDKLYSFASDGASVVSSQNKGVAGLLAKRSNPCILCMHCIAHKQALMMKDATSFSAFATWFDKSMSETLNFFCRSVKRVQELESFAVQLELIYTRVLQLATTRWLSRGNCTQRLVAVFAALVAQFRANEDEVLTAAALLAQITSQQFVSSLCLMVGILIFANKLNAQ